MFKSLFLIILSLITITKAYTVSGYVYYKDKNSLLTGMPNAELRWIRADGGSKYYYIYTDNTGFYSKTVSGTGIDSLIYLTPNDATYNKMSPGASLIMFFEFHPHDSVHNFILYRPILSGYVKSKILSYPENEEQDTIFSGITVNIGDTSVQTDNNGYYEWEIPCNTNVMISPVFPDTGAFTFYPRNVSSSNGDISAIFIGKVEYFYISGQVYIKNGDHLRNLVKFSVCDEGYSSEYNPIENITTDIFGYYNIKIPSNWSGTISPYVRKDSLSRGEYISHCEGYPLSYSFKRSNVSSNITQNFIFHNVAVRCIHGMIYDSDNNSIEGVSLSFSGKNGTTITDNKGYYVHHIYDKWEGTITPTKQGYLFGSYFMSFQYDSPWDTIVNFKGILKDKPQFTSKNRDTVNIANAFNYTITYVNPIGGNVTINILNKPLWLQLSSNVILSGIPSITGKDTVIAELLINGKSYDTLALYILIDVTVFFTSVTMDTAVLNTPFDYHLRYTPIVNGITFNVFKKPEWLSLDLTLLRGTPLYGDKIDTVKVELLYENVPIDTLILSILIESPVGIIPGAFVKNKVVPEVHIYNLLGRKVLVTQMAKRYPTLGTGIYQIVYRIDKKLFINKMIIGKKF